MSVQPQAPTVNIQETLAQVNRVGNAIGIVQGAVPIAVEEWQKLLGQLQALVQSFVNVTTENAALKKELESLKPKPAEEKKTETTA